MIKQRISSPPVIAVFTIALSIGYIISSKLDSSRNGSEFGLHVNSAQIAASVLLLIGVSKNYYLWLVPWMITTVFQTYFLIYFSVDIWYYVLIFGYTHLIGCIVSAYVALGLLFYFLFVMYNRFQNMRENEHNSMKLTEGTIDVKTNNQTKLYVPI